MTVTTYVRELLWNLNSFPVDEKSKKNPGRVKKKPEIVEQDQDQVF